MTSLVLLLHSSAGSYQAALRRARLVQRGAELAYPSRRFDRLLGRTPDDDPTTGSAPTTQRLVDHAARRLSRQGGALDSDPIGAVWVVSEITPDVEAQLTIAAGAGLAVRVLGDEEVEWLLGIGEAAERARELAPEDEVDEGEDGPEFRSPAQVLSAYFGGAQHVLGVRALPVARLARCGGNAHGRKSQLEECGLRISLAAGIVHRAMAQRRWRREWLTVLRVAYACGGTMAQAAEAAGLGDDDAARRRASRMRSRAEEAIRDELEETLARCALAKKCLPK